MSVSLLKSNNVKYFTSFLQNRTERPMVNFPFLENDIRNFSVLQRKVIRCCH